MIVDVYSHSVHITFETQEKLWALKGFLNTLTQWDIEYVDGEPVNKPLKNFSVVLNDKKTVAIHINLLEQFIRYYEANLYGKHDIKINVHKAEINDKCIIDLKVKNLFTPRENQKTVLEYLQTRSSPTQLLFDGKTIPIYDNNKVVTMPTGEGKTFVSQYLLNETKLRTMYMMRSSYIDRWVPDLENTFHFKAGDIQIIRGATSLIAAMENAIDGVNIAKVYFISTGTYTAYTDSWNSFGKKSPYPINPLEFFKVMNIGRCVIDEGHQMPHQLMKYFCNLHIYDQNTLSATLETMDPFMTKIFGVMYPIGNRCSGGTYAPHIKVTALKYTFGNIRKVSYMGAKGYNHAKFETSLQRKGSKTILNDYLDLVWRTLEERYYKRELNGTKALIFFATIDMCDLFLKYIQPRMMDKKVVRYVGSKDKMSVITPADVIVSTVQSCGTAVDIPDLLVSIMTTAIDSQQSNEQTVGRTRPLKSHPNVSPEFVYFMCTDIQKHSDYHRNKLKFFTKKALSHEEFDSETIVGPVSDDYGTDVYQPQNSGWQNKSRWQNKGNWNSNNNNNIGHGNKGGNRFNAFYDKKNQKSAEHNKYVSRPNFNRGNRPTFKSGPRSFHRSLGG